MTAINAVTDLAVDDGIAVLTLDSPPVNALSAAVRDGLAAGVAAAAAAHNVRALVLISAGSTGAPPAAPRQQPIVAGARSS